jgi:hypothetical protein
MIALVQRAPDNASHDDNRDYVHDGEHCRPSALVGQNGLIV